MEKKFELRKLSNYFYECYPPSLFPEIEQKRGRPYVIFLVEIDKHIFAIPFRTNIRHSYCYKFKSSDRKTSSATGLDFSKAILINDPLYLGEETYINNSEYYELIKKYYYICKNFKKYIKQFITLNQNSDKYLQRKYKYSTLHYFRDHLIDK